MIDVTKLIEMKEKIIANDRKISELEEETHEMAKILQEICNHPTIKTEEHYYGGGYDYVSSVRIVKTCTLCEKIVESYDDPTHKGMYG